MGLRGQRIPGGVPANEGDTQGPFYRRVMESLRKYDLTVNQMGQDYR
jgi:hypothetical protein